MSTCVRKFFQDWKAILSQSWFTVSFCFRIFSNLKNYRHAMGHILMNFTSQDFLQMLYNFLWKNYMKRYKQGPGQTSCHLQTWGSHLSYTLVSLVCGSWILNCIINAAYRHRNTSVRKTAGKRQIKIISFLSLVIRFTKVNICLFYILFSYIFSSSLDL